MVAGRIIFEILLVALLIGAILYGVYRLRAYQLSQEPPQEKYDISTRPSEWYTISQTSSDGNYTIIGIQRVEKKSKKVVEYRKLRVIDNRQSGYAKRFDEAMDEAYEAMRNANVTLVRR